MQLNFDNDPELFNRCINLIDEIFPGCKDFAEKGMKYHASWSECSTPFVIEEKGNVIAHAGVWPITIMVNGSIHKTASVHGVCVKPEYRGKGYFKQLMNEAIQFAAKNFESTILFTNKPYLYRDYSDRKIMLPEYDFLVTAKYAESTNTDLRKLNLDNSADLNLLHQLLSNHIAVSDELSILNANTLFILNTLNIDIQYSDNLQTAIVYMILNNTLYVRDILSQKTNKISDIIKLIPGQYDKIVFQFNPDKYLNENEYAPFMAGPECCLMVSDTFPFKGKYFRYPEIYVC